MDDEPRRISSDLFTALLERASSGDADALEGLIVFSHARLLGFARRLIGPEWVGKIDAEDVLQDAYAAMYRDIAQCRVTSAEMFLAWAREIVRNRFIDSARRLRRAKRSAVGEQRWQVLQELTARMERDRPSVSAGLQREDLRAALIACLARLPEHYREVIQRAHLDGVAWPELAGETGESEDALRRRGGRALEKLGECLGRASRFLTTLH